MTTPRTTDGTPTPPRPIPADVYHAVAEALAPGGSATLLESIVRGYTVALRDAGLPPERALVRVKQVVGVPATAARRAEGTLVRADEISHAVVTWFLSAYYRAD